MLDALTEDLNLGFEASDQPEGWFAGGEGYRAVIDEEEVHSGSRSLRIDCLEPGSFGVATSRFPVEAVKGKRLRLIGFVRTRDVNRNYAGLWMRVDGPDGVLAFDNMNERGLSGTTGWTRCEIELDVAQEATNINFGGLHTGDGTAWFDSFTFEVSEQPPPPPEIEVLGWVVGPDGEPVEGASVALIKSTADQSAFFARSGEDGVFTVELPAGEYAVTATARGLMAAYLAPAAYGPEEPGDELLLSLDEAQFTIRGTVTDEFDEPLAATPISIYRLGKEVGDIFFTETDEQGRYELAPIPGDEFVVNVWDKGLAATAQKIPGGADTTVDFRIIRPGPAPDEVVSWITEHAVPLSTAEAGNGFSDMQPLKQLVGDARVVALGEATHGSREFFQLKHRFLEFLVEEMGFTVFAIEANWPECLAINDYVLKGAGDAREALAGIYFWTWNTEEVLAQIEWMRRYNADPEHINKVKFLGFDMQTTTVAAREVTAYLEKVDPEAAQEAHEKTAALQAEMNRRSIQNMSATEQEDLSKAVDDILAHFDASENSWIAKTGKGEWTVARHEVVLLQQALEMMTHESSSARDRAMAANVEWILETEPSGTRVVVWAHNGHVSRHARGRFEPMGSHLDPSLGEDYVVLGFVFNRGSFQAIDWTRGRDKGSSLKEHTVGPAPEGNFGAVFARTVLPIFVLDLRQVPSEGVTGTWFGVPHPMRAIGAVFQGEKAMSFPIVLQEHFDAVIFVDETTRARPLKPTEHQEGTTR